MLMSFSLFYSGQSFPSGILSQELRRAEGKSFSVKNSEGQKENHSPIVLINCSNIALDSRDRRKTLLLLLLLNEIISY